MNQLFLNLALVVGSTLSPMCCWASMDDVRFHSDQVDFHLNNGEACIGSGQVRTGSMSAHTNQNGWTITSITLTAVIDGRVVPPPVDLFTSTQGTAGVNVTGTSGSFSTGVQDAIQNALEDGQDHSFAGRVTIHMEDDQGVDQSQSFSTTLSK